MNPADIRSLYAYTDWANERLLHACADVADEAFTREIASSFSSIRDTLAHVAFAEWLWLQRWLGASPKELPEWTKNASFTILRDRFRSIADERRAYLESLTGDAIDASLHYTSTEGDPFSMRLGDLLVHCANHSTYHRGQLVTMLRQVGVKPPNTDYTQFVRSRQPSSIT